MVNRNGTFITFLHMIFHCSFRTFLEYYRTICNEGNSSEVLRPLKLKIYNKCGTEHSSRESFVRGNHIQLIVFSSYKLQRQVDIIDKCFWSDYREDIGRRIVPSWGKNAHPQSYYALWYWRSLLLVDRAASCASELHYPVVSCVVVHVKYLCSNGSDCRGTSNR